MFFSFDGVDGGGKSTQLGPFCDWLRAAGHDVMSCRDPGSTPLGDSVRDILLHAQAGTVCRMSEMLLYMAARAQLVENLIEPALAARRTVVCDRFLLANVVYQGHAGGLDVDEIWRIGRLATKGIEPDLTFVLDLSDETAAARMNRPLDRMERQGSVYRSALREGYLREARRRPDRIVVIDASRDVETIQADIRRAATRILPAK